MMHIVHLAIIPDVLTSFLLDATDHGEREAKLAEYWNNYRAWAESQGCLYRVWKNFLLIAVYTSPFNYRTGRATASRASTGLQDRCERKLFTSAVLKPKSENYLNISQQILSATGARYMILWLCNLVRSLLVDPGFEKTPAFLPLPLMILEPVV